LGYGGQNDRGALESLRCGTPIMLASYNRHAFFFKNNDKIVRLASSPNDYNATAIEIKEYLQEASMLRKETTTFFEDNSGVETVILPEMKRLFGILKNNTPNNKILLEEYKNEI